MGEKGGVKAGRISLEILLEFRLTLKRRTTAPNLTLGYLEALKGITHRTGGVLEQ